VTITLSGDCGLKLEGACFCLKDGLVTITLSGDCGLKLSSSNRIWSGLSDNYLIRWLWIETGLLGNSRTQGKWQLPYQVIVDWNVIMWIGDPISLWWQLPYQVIVDWNNGFGNYLENFKVTITLSGDCGLKPMIHIYRYLISISDNYLIRWLWIETG